MALAELMQELLTCAENELASAGRPTSRVLLNPGDEVPWDDCCSGQLWVRLRQLTPTGSQGNCGVTLYKATLSVGVLRCAAVIQDNMEAPPAADMTADAVGMTLDAELLLKALNCCFKRTGMNVTNWFSLGVQTCVGGEWTVDVPMTVPCGCDD